MNAGVIPYPKSVDVGGRRDVSCGLQLSGPVADLVERLFPGQGIVGDGIPVHASRRNRILTKEEYEIEFTPGRVTIAAFENAGLQYGLITLCQMLRAARLDPDRFVLPSHGMIVDKPRLPFRGLLLDVARQVFTVAEIEHVIDCMAWNKLNYLHLHLTDDQGWRLDIPKYPQLTERVSYRGKGLLLPPSLGSGDEPYGIVYTASDIRALRDHAEALGVTIIPEIEMPGHSYAILQAMPELRDPCDRDQNGNTLNPALPQTYEVVRNILDYVDSVFRSPHIHLGGDEVWEGAWPGSPAAQEMMANLEFTENHELQSHFLRTIQAYVRDHLGREVGLWEEAATGDGIDRAKSYATAWLTDGLKLAKAGYSVVATPKNFYYVDHPPFEGAIGMENVVTPQTTYNYDPNAEWPAELRHKLIGTMASMWGEFIYDKPNMDMLMTPRASAVAESAWTPAASKDWRRFDRLQRLMPRWVKQW